MSWLLLEQQLASRSIKAKSNEGAARSVDAVLAALAADSTVVTANKRLARSIGLAFDRQQRAAGKPAWRSPDVLPWQAWVQRLWGEAVTADSPAGRYALLTPFQAGLLWKDIARAADPMRIAGAERPVADLASRAWQLAVEWRLAPGDLAAAADSADTFEFARWAEEFRARCAAAGSVDSEAVLPLLAADIEQGKLRAPKRLHFVGFDEWLPSQRHFITVLAAAGCTICEEAPAVAGDGHGEGHGDACRVLCADERAELESAARWARLRFEQDPARRIAIVVPDLAERIGETRRVVLDIFDPQWRLSPEREQAVNFSYSHPLASHGMVRAALLVLHALRGALDYREAGQLLRTPYLAGSQAEAAGRAAIDLRLRQQIGTTVDVRVLAQSAAADAPLLAGKLALLAELAATMPRRQGADEWATVFQSALQLLAWPGDRALASDEYQAGAACQDLWSELRGCNRLAQSVTLEEALELIESLARDRQFQPAGAAGAVQVLGVMEALGQRFDALWICGMTSAAWPPATRPSPLLPLALQRSLRMPDSAPALVREKAERRLEWLQASAATVVVSSAEFAGDEPLSPSPLTSRIRACTLDEIELAAVTRPADALVANAATFVVADDPAPPVADGIELRGGASLLERQARCPARAFLQFRLGARELATPTTGIDPATRGTIVHEILQGIFQRIRSHAQLNALGAAEEHELVARLITRTLNRHLPLSQPLIREIAANERLRLHDVLGRFLQSERERESFDVLWTEEMPPTHAAPAAVAKLAVRLRPDRVDRLADGRTLIIDYKTGRDLPGPADLCSPRLRAPQLPLYATLSDADGIAFARLSASPIVWRGIGRETWGIAGVKSPADFTRDAIPDWSVLRAGWWSALQRLAEELLAGSFDIDRWRSEDAEGQWAMATRVHELPEEEADGA